MRIEVNNQTKIISIWFSNEEKSGSLAEKLRQQYSYFAKQGYLVAEYCSGKKELLECTRNLLISNIQNKCRTNLRS